MKDFFQRTHDITAVRNYDIFNMQYKSTGDSFFYQCAQIKLSARHDNVFS